MTTAAAKKAAAVKPAEKPVEADTPTPTAGRTVRVADAETDEPEARVDYLEQALLACQSRGTKSTEFATAWATLALAEEQRTANLIAVLALGPEAWADLYGAGVDADQVTALVVERLSIGTLGWSAS